MPDKLAHYVKFARSLAMTSTLALQACSGSTDTTDEPASTAPTPSASSTTSARTAETTGEGGSGGSAPVVADAGTSSDVDASTPVDAGHLSGPLPPPELPRSLAIA